MSDTQKDLQRLQLLLQNLLHSGADSLEAASICRSLALSETVGSGVFFLFALFLESLRNSLEGAAVEADRYELAMAVVIPTIEECISAVRDGDQTRLVSSVSSFARTALSVKIAD